MGNQKISQLPTYSGSTTGTWLILNDSTETNTYKVLTTDIAGTSGTSGSSGYGFDWKGVWSPLFAYYKNDTV